MPLPIGKRHGDARFAVALVLWLLLTGGIGVSAELATLAQRTFPDCCARPDWWAEVPEQPRVGTIEELLRVWQDQAVSDRRKAKVFYQAMMEHQDSNPEIVAQAINLYGYVDPDYPSLLVMQECGVGRYFHLDRSLDGYAGEVGDTSAGLVRDLAQSYHEQGRLREAETLLRALFEQREAEINDHLLELASLELAEVLWEQGRYAQAIERLTRAKHRYQGSWKQRIDDTLDSFAAELGWRRWWYQPQTPLLLGGILLMAVAGSLAWRFVRRDPEGGRGN